MTSFVDPKIATALQKVLNQIRDTGPEELLWRVQGELRKTPINASEEDLSAAVAVSDLNDDVRRSMHMALAIWDSVATAEWIQDTKPGTPNRRERIYELLEISDANQRVLLHRARSRVRRELSRYLDGAAAC